ncbi:Uncharacterised 5xTM membrane BCR, YitT family COG1284 [Azotobacter beijerinckii]|uniref:Uncharacterized 5xTM membrane BCR, YitT family COG1284 n=1 Tax=Azotobacter beijerinckii TaxID=170623 RepID=A0A1H9GJE2_9GAMM|nr:YitT family protein [Azotobacter beijerinckii]SEQ50008.1 Uncharacterised 5xTM membrane BCR, YitT family COG1284 [Azotobacter beijerinckii]
MPEALKERHSLLEDVQAILFGTVMIAFALNLFAHSQLLVGGAAGLALIGHYLSGFSVGTCFFLINLPFYYLGYRQLGLPFILRTIAAIACLSLLSDLTPRLVGFERLDPLYAAVLGGSLIGVGFIIIFRHGSSLGGINILVLYLQKKHGLGAGKVQLAVDASILLAACFLIPWSAMLYSLLSAFLANSLMIFNFKSSRYNGFS